MAKKPKKSTAVGQVYHGNRRPLSVPGLGEIPPCTWVEVSQEQLEARGVREALRKAASTGLRFLPIEQTCDEPAQDEPPAEKTSEKLADGGESKAKTVRAKPASGSSAEE